MVAILVVVALGFATPGAAKAFALPLHVGPAQSVPPQLDSTATSVSSTEAATAPGIPVKLTASVTDTSSTPSAPGGIATFTDEGAGGTFSATTCALSTTSSGESACSVTYTATAPIGSNVTILVIYAGDATHVSSARSFTLQVSYLSTIVVSPRSLSVTGGKVINFTATVAGPKGAKAPAPQGDVSWSDNAAGGSFGTGSCILARVNNYSSACTVTYSAPSPSNATIGVEISAAYPGSGAYSASSGSASLTVSPPTVPMTVSYALVGNGTGVLPPTFTYTASNQTKTVLMTGTPTTYTADVNSEWFVSNQLANSSQSDAWNLDGGAQGNAAFVPGGFELTFTYYHQYSVDLGYSIVGGTAGASVPPFVTFTSFGVTMDTGAPGRTWVDVGTLYSYPAQIPGSIGNVRWIAQNVSGIVTGPGDLSPTYYHQYSLSVSFTVKDSPGNQAAPIFTAVAMGSRFNVSLGSLASKTWLDAGSKYSLTDPLAGATSTVRWSAGNSSSGVVTDSDIAVTYYMQNPVLASFKTNDASVPAQVRDGSPTPTFASIVSVSGGVNVTVPLTTQPQEVWLDSGTGYTIQNVLLALPGERWVATGDVTGTVAPGASASQTYFHEFLLNVSHAAPGALASPPSLTFTALGSQAQSPLTPQGSPVWADAGTRFFVPDTLPGDRWYAPSAPDGVASSANMTVIFYHQYELNASLAVVGGGLPSQSSISGMSGGQPFTELLGTSTVGVWLDSGTNYTIPQTLLHLATERWVAASNLSGTASSPSAVTQLYYHQALLNLSSTGGPSSAPGAEVAYVSFGVKEGTALGQNSTAVWADVGTSFSVQSIVNVSAGERWYSGISGGNVTGPVQDAARYFHQYLLSYSYTATGANMTPPPALAVVEAGRSALLNLTSQTGLVWADAGTHWQAAAATLQSGERWLAGAPTQGTVTGPASLQLSYALQFLVVTSASPASGGNVTRGGWYNASSQVTLLAVAGQGWAIGGWRGAGASAQSGTGSTLSLQLRSSVNETAQFDPSLTIISSNGGSVKYTTGPSVQSIDSGRSAQTYVAGDSNVTLEAHASFPFQFVKWSGIDANTSDPLSLSVTAPTVIQAIFAPSYLDLIGLPTAVFASCLTVYLARHSILASGKQLLRNLRIGRRS